MKKKIIIKCAYCNGTGQVEITNVRQMFGYRVTMARQKIGLTQAELAQKFGSSRTSITNIESGRQNLPINRVYELAEILGVEARDLL